MILGRRNFSKHASHLAAEGGKRTPDGVSVMLSWLALVVVFGAIGEALQMCCTTFN